MMHFICYKQTDGYFYGVVEASRSAWEIYSQSEKSAKIIASLLRPSLPLRASAETATLVRSLGGRRYFRTLARGGNFPLLLFLSLAVAIAKVDASLSIRALVGLCLG